MTLQVCRHVLHSDIRRVMLLLVWLCCLAQGQSRDKAIVTGRVENESGEPLEFANVLIVGTLDGDVTGPKGQFTFRTSHVGQQVVRASMVGMESATMNDSKSG